jgi:tubby-related protein 1
MGRSNFLGTLFTIYDSKRDKGERNERAAVIYQPNILGLRGPRKLTLLLPGLTSDGRIKPLPYEPGGCQLNEKFKTDEIADILVMRNKFPQWNEGKSPVVASVFRIAIVCIELS